MTIATELEALYDENGLLHVDTAHDWAEQNPTSDLHNALEWDDAIAAREHRYWQIRRLIAIHVVDVEHKRRTVSLVPDRSRGGGYRDLDNVMEVPSLREIAVRDALQAYQRLREKYYWLSELAEIHSSIDRAQQVRRAAAATAAQAEQHATA
jgi:hypothetical protein